MNNKANKLHSTFKKCLQESYKDQDFLKSLKITFGGNLVVIRWVDGPTAHQIKKTTENLCEKNKLLIVCNRSYSDEVIQKYWEKFVERRPEYGDSTLEDYIFIYDDFGFDVIKKSLANINLSKGGSNGKHE